MSKNYQRGQTITCHRTCNAPEKAALNDLILDFRRVLDSALSPIEDPRRADIRLVNLQNEPWPGAAVRRDERERYEVRLEKDQLVVIGSDARGLIYGIYHLSEKLLGVDPLWFWADFPPEARPFADPAAAVGVSMPATFKYRGWFVNGEDILIGWPHGPSPLRMPMPHWGHTGMVSYETYEKIFEAMLRLRLNFIVPATFTDVAMPPYAALFDRIVARGLMFSHHHIEPVGVCPGFAFRHYCQRHKLEPHFSWLQNRPAVEACWREHIDRLAKYGDQIIWQLGYRGADDMPFWESEEGAPADMAERAQVVNSAMQRQYELIGERLGHASFAGTATLWSEGRDLERTGILRYPPGIIRVWADDGRTQTLPPDLENIRGRVPSGIYYHTSYWSTGPHLVQGNPPENTLINCKRAIDAGATDFFLQHVSNIRPFTLNLRHVAEIMGGMCRSPDEFLRAFCSHYYGAESVAGIYADLFRAFIRVGKMGPLNADPCWLDGSLDLLAKTLVNLLVCERIDNASYNKTFQGAFWRLQYIVLEKDGWRETDERTSPENFMFKNWRDFCAHLVPILRSSLARWHSLQERIEAEYGQMTKGRRLYDENLRWQVALMATLTEFCLVLMLACSAKADGNSDALADYLEKAGRVLESANKRRTALAEQGHFKDWFKGEILISFQRFRKQIEDLCVEAARKEPAYA